MADRNVPQPSLSNLSAKRPRSDIALDRQPPKPPSKPFDHNLFGSLEQLDFAVPVPRHMVETFTSKAVGLFKDELALKDKKRKLAENVKDFEQGQFLASLKPTVKFSLAKPEQAKFDDQINEALKAAHKAFTNIVLEARKEQFARETVELSKELEAATDEFKDSYIDLVNRTAESLDGDPGVLFDLRAQRALHETLQHWALKTRARLHGAQAAKVQAADKRKKAEDAFVAAQADAIMQASNGDNVDKLVKHHVALEFKKIRKDLDSRATRGQKNVRVAARSGGRPSPSAPGTPRKATASGRPASSRARPGSSAQQPPRPRSAAARASPRPQRAASAPPTPRAARSSRPSASQSGPRPTGPPRSRRPSPAPLSAPRAGGGGRRTH